MKQEHVEVIMSLVRQYSTARVRRVIVGMGKGSERETKENVQKRVEQAEATLRRYLEHVLAP